MLLCHVLHHGELIGPHRAGPDVSNLTALHQVMQGFHGLFNRSVLVEPMNLQKIDVARLQTLQGRIDGIEDGLS